MHIEDFIAFYYQRIKPHFMLLTCPICKGQGGFTGGEVPGADAWSECDCWYDHSPIDDSGGPDMAGKLPIWKLGLVITHKISPGQWHLRDAVKCRLGWHDVNEWGACKRCWENTRNGDKNER